MGKWVLLVFLKILYISSMEAKQSNPSPYDRCGGEHTVKITRHGQT